MAVKKPETTDGTAIKVSKDITRLKTISISSFQKNIDAARKKTEEKQDEIVAGPNEKFSEEQFIITWNEIAQVYKEMGKDSLFVTLTKRKPSIDSENKITLTIDNKAQEQGLEKEKQNILELLRVRLSNFSISFEFRVEEAPNETHLYTTKDKFNKLAEKNPNLLELKKRLNLDFDF